MAVELYALLPDWVRYLINLLHVFSQSQAEKYKFADS